MNVDDPTSLPTVLVLETLRYRRDAIAWAQRVELAVGLRNQIRADGVTPDALSLLDLLACDPKPEVRHAVVQILPHLPDGDFERIANAMAEDCHAYVRRGLQRVVSSRAKTTEKARTRRVGFDQISQQLQAIEQRHGTVAAQAAWRLSERYTQLLVGSMVHDLRSILTHLRANAAILAGDVHRAAPQQKISQRVKDDIEFLERTVHDMECFTEQLSNAKSPQKLLELVHAAREHAEAAVRKDNSVDLAMVAVHIEIPAWITVHVVPHLLVSALTNIIKNAFEAFAQSPASNAKPAINITAATDDSWVELAVRDNGMGFAPEEITALKPFTPGRRNKTKRNSTGYGLPNAMRNIAAHGGTVQIESEENMGSTITIRLSLKDAGVSEAGDAS